jgi:hypothetical protein
MSQALIDLDLFDPGGCETPPLPFNPEQIEVIKKVVNGEAFENPISGAVNGALNGLDNAVGKLEGIKLRLTDSDQIDAVSGLADALENASSIVTDFSNHSDRLSGVLDSDGEVPGLAGLNSLAKSFNNVKNAIDGNPAEAVIDHYSAMFSGILGPGSSAFNAVNALIDGDLQQVLGELDAFDGDGDGFPNLSSIVNSVTDLQNDITNIINGDNDFALAAVDYLAKVSLDTSVLQMAEDPCFGQKLLQQIGSPDIKGLLNL